MSAADSPAGASPPDSPLLSEAKTGEEEDLGAVDTPLDLPNVADFIAESVRARVGAAVAEMTATLGDLESWKAERERMLQEQLQAVDALPRAASPAPDIAEVAVERTVSVSFRRICIPCSAVCCPFIDVCMRLKSGVEADSETRRAAPRKWLPGDQEARLAAILAGNDPAASVARIENDIATLRVDMYTAELNERLAKLSAENERVRNLVRCGDQRRCCLFQFTFACRTSPT
jgi:hypothetical protein